MKSFLWVGRATKFLLVLAVGCEQDIPKGDSATARAVQPTPAAASAAPGEPRAETSAEATNDLALRRSYAAMDMKVHDCVAVGDDGVLTGKLCPSAFVVFGPYVGVPPNSNLRISFEVHAGTKLGIVSDVVSNVGKQYHGELEEQRLNEGEARKIGYRIHLSSPASAVEARIGVRTDIPANFRITDLAVSVE